MEIEISIDTPNENKEILLNSLGKWLDNENINNVNISYSRGKLEAGNAGAGIIESILIVFAEKAIEKILESTYTWFKSKYFSSGENKQEIKIYIKRKDEKTYKLTPEEGIDREEVDKIKNFIENV